MLRCLCSLCLKSFAVLFKIDLKENSVVDCRCMLIIYP